MGWSRAHHGKNSWFEIRGGEGMVMWIHRLIVIVSRLAFAWNEM